jgi:phage FluMu protein Com
MGIHFACHHCNHSLHVKDFQGGKRGRCPECKSPFRIPLKDTSHSLALDDSAVNPEAMLTFSTPSKTAKTSKKSSSAISIETDVPTKNSNEKSARPKKAKAASQKPSNVDPRTRTPIDNNLPIVSEKEMPAALSASLDAKWFVRPPSGGQFGPASPQLLMEWIAERRVTSDSFLWCEGMSQWRAATDLIPELVSPDMRKPPASLETSMAGSEQTTTTMGDVLSLEPTGTVASGLVKKKREQKRRQQLTAVILLGAVSLILFGVLIYVLLFRVAASS